ncbi:hypothetical protein [Methylotuvimicrobium sp. KM1]|uniref:hypothetical protein n=1 Tax=Methylotuvimicrobium sp. KM1 TaxID=3377707 RepID=UPI0038504244
MATEVGIVQAATVALFYAFSANARSLILNQHTPVAAVDILHFRVLLLLPLSIAAYFLSSVAMEVELTIVVALILRQPRNQCRSTRRRLPEAKTAPLVKTNTKVATAMMKQSL